MIIDKGLQFPNCEIHLLVGSSLKHMALTLDYNKDYVLFRDVVWGNACSVCLGLPQPSA